MKKLLCTLMLFIIILIIFNILIVPNSDIEKEDIVETSPTMEIVETPEITENNNDVIFTDYVPIVADNTTGFKTSWYTMSTDGYVVVDSDYLNQKVLIKSGGSNIDSNQLYRDGIPYVTGNEYIISFNANSTIDRKIKVVLSNADNNEVYLEQEYALNSTDNNYSFSFKMENDSTFNGRISFYIGKDSIEQEHSINFSKIMISNISAKDNTIKINHIGYDSKDEKRCVFPYNQGDYFNVINIETNEIVYTGAIVNEVKNELTGETNYYGDFSNVTDTGRYRIESQIIGNSYDFDIGDNIYSSVTNSLLSSLSSQRCGEELSSEIYGLLGHKICHNSLAKVYGTDNMIDVTGGWHDAGDFGRYTKTGAKAVMDLLLVAKNDDSILNEARYELEWMLKMQADSGDVYSKAVTANLPGDIASDMDTTDIYVLSSNTAATGVFAGTMAYAYNVYQDVDQEFAGKCLEAAKKAWEYLYATPDNIEESNPEDINAGVYRDSSDIDERFFASISLWCVTNEDKYYDYAIDMLNKEDINGVSYVNVADYGKYLFLINSNAYKMKEYQIIKDSLINEANNILSIGSSDGYNTTVYSYNWGSNGDIVNNGIVLMMAYSITGDQKYRQMAVEQLNYVFGKNCLNRTFVTGFGYNSPNYIHHRPSIYNNLIPSGFLVGGVNSNREDDVIINMPLDTPPAKVYVDDNGSYSTNEVSIYWNSSLIALIRMLY